ncbi:MAG: hypothetical protein V2I35_12985, partial [Desulfocapsaceae bacterium]|nr:hypothetical protein [Desulfocapsaceae bacterium]
ARISRLRAAAEAVLYTPGSSVGRPISVLRSFAPPPAALLQEPDLLQERIQTMATSLLALLGIAADPITSREHILIASPAFTPWLQGEPLDIQKMLYGEDGKPRTAIFSIAHLSEAERMFFVTLLLTAMISWMRRQQGTSSLKALLYMDEIFGYFPPSANPPSKKPMLLLLKQARAFGVGVVLSTQNPVDLDYKGLSNIGTWFVGRLQTSQDQNRVLDGIVGSSDGVLDRTTVKQLLSDMKGRQFLLTSAHLDEPLMFETRWVMSYLKGPISLQEIGTLMAGRQVPVTAAPALGQAEKPGAADGVSEHPVILNEGVEQRYFMPPILADEMVFEPWLAGSATVRFYNSSRNIDELRHYRLKLYLDRFFSSGDWKEAEPLEFDIDECPTSAPERSSFYELPEMFSSFKTLASLEKEFSDFLYQSERLELIRAPDLKIESGPGESEADFLVRVADHQREEKETAAEKLLETFNKKRQQLERKLDSALLKIEKEKGDVTAKTTDTMLSIGTAVLGAFFGRKALSSTTITRTASGFRKAGQVAKEKGDVQRAEAAVAEIQEQIQRLNNDQAAELQELVARYDPALVKTEVFAIKPRRSDIFDLHLCLLWEMVPPRR